MQAAMRMRPELRVPVWVLRWPMMVGETKPPKSFPVQLTRAMPAGSGCSAEERCGERPEGGDRRDDTDYGKVHSDGCEECAAGALSAEDESGGRDDAGDGEVPAAFCGSGRHGGR